MEKNDPTGFETKLRLLEEQARQQQEKLNELAEAIRELRKISPEASADALSPATPPPPPPQASASPFQHTRATTPQVKQAEKKPVPQPTSVPPSGKGDVESFIGQRIASILGIIVLVVGIVFGIKYAIDANLITPVTRVVAGFISGAALITLAFRMRINYKALSAVILSGGLAVLYYSAFAGFHYYQLYPKLLAFAIMAALTIFGVIAGMVYNLQIIGILGLTGAYAVPFLLSDGSGDATMLFGYMAIINVGILFLCLNRNWKLLENIAFYLTWLIFAVWYVTVSQDYQPGYWKTTAAFSLLFFFMFYAAIMIRSLRKNGAVHFTDILRLGANSLIFFLVAGNLVDDLSQGKLTGLFSLCNALVHFGLAAFLFRKKLADKTILHTLLVLVITFVTITFPLQLDGPWVTVFWGMEGLLLFWIGRKAAISAFTTLGALLIIPTAASLLHDWTSYYNLIPFSEDISIRSFYNAGFFSTLFSGLIFAGYFFLNRTSKLPGESSGLGQIMANMIAPVLAVTAFYFGGYLEISTWADVRINATSLLAPENNFRDFDYSLLSLRSVLLNIYSLLFFSLIAFLQPLFKRSLIAGWTLFTLNALVLLISISGGLRSVSALRNAWLNPSELFPPSISYSFLGYLFYLAFFVLLYLSWRNLKQNGVKNSAVLALWFYFSQVLVLVILSHFVTHLFIISDSANMARMESISFRAGYSILWAFYSLCLIGYGMKNQQIHARIAGFVLLAITVVKLLLMDTSNLPVLARVIAFISVGILLLVVSWLYYRKRPGKKQEHE